MSFDKPSDEVFVLQCDACFDTLEFTAAETDSDEFVDPKDTVACLLAAKRKGWRSDKHVGFSWEHYCPGCAKLPDSERHPRAK